VSSTCFFPSIIPIPMGINSSWGESGSFTITSQRSPKRLWSEPSNGTKTGSLPILSCFPLRTLSKMY
jgi:hypothetical protein